eukprot:GEMP01012142.1.p1 GENE.GEMP01012142.1~~GEMP01012142.1.p1  ORF type:complete len:644 (+),score=128.31 GEMP01012142.1:155-2086(+)
MFPLSSCGKPPVAQVIPSISCTVYYPMYCVPLHVALRMKSVERHEVLLARSELVKLDLGDEAPVIFLSHQWVSTEHPDPEATQFTVFQGAMRRLLAGYDVCSDWTHSHSNMANEACDSWPILLKNALVWYDYFSIPQEAANIDDTQGAIQSIPAYIEMCAFTFVLAPTVDHKEFADDSGEPLSCNYYTWQRRGWCRLELLATYLKANSHSLVVIRSESLIQFAPAALLASQSRVADGDFACCMLNHERLHPDGKVSPIPCDKPALFRVVDTLIWHRLNTELRKGNLRVARQLKAYSHIWSRDLGGIDNEFNDRNDTLDVFLENYAFATPHDFDGGWTPLRFACIGGNVNAVRQLLEESADPEANLARPGGANFPMEKGSSILCHTIRLCCSSEHEEILDLLVAHKAKLESPSHLDALTSASLSLSLNKRGAHWFLRTFPDWDVNKRSVADDNMSIPIWPLAASLCASADLPYVRLLLEHNAELGLQTWPMSDSAFTMACAFCPTASPDIAEYILHKIRQRLGEDSANGATSINIQLIRDEVNRRTGMNAPCWIRACLKAKRAMNIGPADARNVFLRFMGATPLLIAASEGKDRVCKWLLDEKADPSIANMDGKTPLSLAQERGFQRVIDVLSVAYARRIENVR